MTSTRLSAYCLKVIEGGWLFVALAIPLFVNPYAYNVFELGKITLFRSVVLVMLLAWLIKFFEERAGRWTLQPSALQFHPRDLVSRNPLAISVAAYAGAYVLATITSVSPGLSLWGGYVRIQGTYTILSYVAFFFLVLDGLRTWKQFDRLVSVIIIGSIPIVAYGLLQYLGRDPFNWVVDSVSPVLSTLGRSNFLAAYLGMIIPLTMGRAIGASSLKGRFSYITLVFFQGLCLIFTLARGVWLGILAGMITFVCLIGLRQNRTGLWAGGLAMGALIAISIGVLNISQGPLDPIKGLPILNRLSTLSETQSGSTAARLTIWRSTSRMIADRPLLGYGPETFVLVFRRYFPPELVYYQGRQVEVDRAHNVFLDHGATVGLVGVLAYVSLIASFYYAALRTLWRRQDLRSQTVLIALLSAMTTYLVQNQFSLDLSATLALFWLFCAMAVAVWRESIMPPVALGKVKGKREGSKRERIGSIRQGAGTWLYLILAGGFSVLILFTNLRPVIADLHFARAVAMDTPQGRDLSIAAARQAVSLAPDQNFYRRFLAEAYAKKASESGDKLFWLQLAVAEIEEARRLAPLDYANWSTLGEFYWYWGSTIEPRKFDDAIQAYEQAVALNPNDAVLYRRWGLLYLDRGDYQTAIEKLRRATELDATDSLAYLYMGEAFLKLVQHNDASLAFLYSFTVDPSSYPACRNLGYSYYLTGRYQDAVKQYETCRQIEQHDPELYLLMAEAYKKLEQYEGAQAILKRGLELIPGNATLQSAIEELEKELGGGTSYP